MKSYLFILLGVVCGFILNMNQACAIMGQSAGSALSYRNMVSDTKTSVRTGVKNEAGINLSEDVPPTIISMENSVTKNIQINLNKEFEVLLKDMNGAQWKISSYNSAVLELQKNEVTGGKRRVKFKVKAKVSTSVFFDLENGDGQVIKNKALYIQVN